MTIRPRKFFFWLHLIAGCVAGVVILIMSVTGVLLAFERQVIAWADGPHRVVPGPESARSTMDTLLSKIEEENDGVRPAAIAVRAETGSPVEFTFGRERVIFVDPHSGKILGEGSRTARSFFSVVTNWHRWLGTSGESLAKGRAATGACNLLFLVLVISGVYLWWPRKWTWPSVRPSLWFKSGMQGRLRDWNWHNTIGFWSAIPLFFIVLTGVIMSYPWANNLLYTLTGSQPPTQREERHASVHREVSDARSLDELWMRAEQRVTGWKSISIRLPEPTDRLILFSIDSGNGGRPDLRAQLALDRKTGAVARWEPFSSYNRGRQFRSYARFLHTGELGGLPGQAIASIASAGASLLVYTGLSLALRRLARNLPKSKEACFCFSLLNQLCQIDFVSNRIWKICLNACKIRHAVEQDFFKKDT